MCLQAQIVFSGSQSVEKDFFYYDVLVAMTVLETKHCLLPSLALNFAVIYSSPGSLAFFLFADALGQPERLRGATDQDQEPI